MIQVQDIDLSGPLAFLIVAGLALVDGVVPLVPARTAVIGLGVVAGTGDLRAYPLLAVATVAAFASDNIAYWLGARFWPRISRLIVRGDRTHQLWDWIERQMRTHGMWLVALARVLPGGPTPITLAAGSIRLPLRRFQVAAALSAILWSAYAFGIGMFGDAVTGGNPLLALLIGLGLAALVNFVLRAGMHLRRGQMNEDPSAYTLPTGSRGPDARTRQRDLWPFRKGRTSALNGRYDIGTASEKHGGDVSSLTGDYPQASGKEASRIVVGVDCSPDSLRALEWAAREARLQKAALEVVHVETFRPEAMQLFSRDLLGDEESVLDAAVARARHLEPSIDVKGRLCEPPAAEALIEASDGARMLVVGSRGLSGFSELAMGSVSSDCARHARCPVLIVRPVERDESPIEYPHQCRPADLDLFHGTKPVS